jgi:hypothetical protein
VFIANGMDPAAIATALTAPPQRGRGGGAATHTPASWIKVTVQPDGAFTITNSRNGFSRTYAPRTR